MKTQYIEAVSEENIKYPSVFLAGGIVNCPDWQQEIVGLLNNTLMTILNPRRANFPIHDPNAAREQITWEFLALRNADIFSMWFSNANSDQPICMYELGRHTALREDRLETIVIGVEPGYRRSQDVYIQLDLINSNLTSKISNSIQSHANNIIKAIEQIQK